MKYIIILSLLFVQSIYSQESKFSYSSSIETQRDSLDLGKINQVKNSYKTSNTQFIINDVEKTITILRKTRHIAGDLIDTFEKFYFVKKEAADGGAFIYYALDIANKKYLEFMIGTERAIICEDCDGFNGCRKFTTYKK